MSSLSGRITALFSQARTARVVAILTAFVLAIGAPLVIQSPAQALQNNGLTAAQLDWGFKSSFRGYILGSGGSITPTGNVSSSSGTYRWTAGAGTVNTGAGTADVSFTGSNLRFLYAAHGIDITLANPRVELISNTSGKLYLDVTTTSGTQSGVHFADLNLTGITPTVTSDRATWTSVPATITAAGTAAAGTSNYPAGTALDNVTFSTATDVEMTLSASPQTMERENQNVTLTATITPASAAGTVQFTDDSVNLGSPVTISAGSAQYVWTASGTGAHTLGASFLPTDSENYAGGTAPLISYTVVDANGLNTSTSLAISPTPYAVVANPSNVATYVGLDLGTQVTLTATVTASTGTPTGTVSFYSTIGNASTPSLLGTVAVVNGVASYTSSTLSAGKNILKATYNPAVAQYLTSTSANSTLSIVDKTAPTHCTPSSTAITSTQSASATWGVYANYIVSPTWVKTPEGNITFDSSLNTFALSSGTVLADTNCAKVSFIGSMKYGKPAQGNYWISITDPTLYISSTGDGVLEARLSTSFDQTLTHRVVLLTFSNQNSGYSGQTVAGTINFNYELMTAAGTWTSSNPSGWANSSAWANLGVWNITPSLRSHFVQTNTISKAPAPMALNFTWPAQPVADSGTSVAEPGYLSWGVMERFRNYTTGNIAQGSISVSNGATANGSVYNFGQSGGSYDFSSLTGNADYSGTVRFYGHSGGLDMSFSNPTVVVSSANSATLYVSINGSRVAFGTVNLAAAGRGTSGGAQLYTNAPVTLTSAGSAAFGSFSSYYTAGMALDPITFQVGTTGAAPRGSVGTISVVSVEKFTPPATPPAKTGIVLSPTALRALTSGEPATITVDGFQPNETGIAIVVYSTPTVLAENLTADANGVVTWTGKLPEGLNGNHTLTIQGSIAKGIELTISDEPEACVVANSTLTWGFKDSFLAYLDSNIANGSWGLTGVTETENGEFVWSNGAGDISENLDAGKIDYEGSVLFTGHEGTLNTTIANPRLVFTSATTADLYLDITGVTQGGTDTAAQAVKFATVEWPQASASSPALELLEGKVVLTQAGAEAFGTYPAGEEMAPLSISSEVSCAEEATSVTKAADASTTAGENGSWWGWVIALVILIAAIALVWVLFKRQRS